MYLSRLGIISFALGVFGASVIAEDDYLKAREAVQAGIEAYRRQEFGSFREHLERAVSLRGDHPTYRYYLAAALARKGDGAGSAAQLKVLADWGLVIDFGEKPDFAAILEAPEVLPVSEQMTVNRAPVGEAQLAREFLAEGGLWEGVAMDPATSRVFASNLHAGTVQVVDTNGKFSEFARAHSPGFGVGGMDVDADRNLLWVSSPALPEVIGFSEEVAGRSEILAFDLKTGAMRHRVELNDGSAESKHTVVDLRVGSDGTVWAADSAAPIVWRLMPGADFAEVFATIETPGPLHSLQSCGLSKDGAWLWVSDYSTGLHLINIATREVSFLPPPSNTTLVGLDGLARCGDSLVAVQNGVNPRRVLRWTIQPVAEPETAPTLSEPMVVLSGHIGLADPTLVAPTADGCLILGDAGWKHFGERAAPDSAKRTVSIFRLHN